MLAHFKLPAIFAQTHCVTFQNKNNRGSLTHLTMGKKKSNVLFSCSNVHVSDVDAEGIKFKDVTRIHANNKEQNVDVILGRATEEMSCSDLEQSF